MNARRFSHLLCIPLAMLAFAGPAMAGKTTSPPMGWNSWDSYGTTLSEADWRANAKYQANHLKQFGWNYTVVDMEWFVQNPTVQGNSKDSILTYDEYGRYIPAPNRFPSSANGAGFKKMSDYAHSLGLKFGIHILRGIPKPAVDKNLPIADSNFHAQDAADTKDTCGWNPDNYGINPTSPAGQAYYKSLGKLYASWGVDFIKIDCLGSRTYRKDETHLYRQALNDSGRDMVFSISPGGVPQSAIDDLRQDADMWRISGDVWDIWKSTGFPAGVADQFDRAASWLPLTKTGAWPDSDMLALGYLGPAPGHGKPRSTLLKPVEQQTYLTLWTIARSPMMVGGNLTKMDPATLALITNPEVIAVDQKSHDAKRALVRGNTQVWTSQSDDGKSQYVAVFNLDYADQAIDAGWSDIGLADGKYTQRDLWKRKAAGTAASLHVSVPAHGSVLYKLSK